MAKLVFGMNQSLDGYGRPPANLRLVPRCFRHFTEQVRDLAGSVYGRRSTRSCAIGTKTIPVGRGGTRLRGGVAEQPKWVVSRSLKSVGPNATLVEDDIEAVIRGLKAQFVREIKLADQTWHKA